MIHQLDETLQFLEQQGVQSAEVGIVLGTGLGSLLSHIEIVQTIPYHQIPHFPAATIEYHKGNLVYGRIKGKTVVVMQGRFHFYEGYSMQQIVYPIRVMKMLGIKYLLLSNAAGGINLTFKKGDLILLEDHLNLQTANPLIGANPDNFGPRFPDMSCPYHPTINKVLRDTAQQLGISLQQGVYAAVNGPNLETRAEYRYLKIIGADMVGMSTVPEVIAANHMSLPCAAISVITDECDPDNLKPVNIQEIIAVAGEADKKLSVLVCDAIKSL